ncbi:MAG: archaemetzincin family Zn-dependent metalloprotease [Candidatus Omnitrophica bacterium]|nr:archaemetzincin family Zn-dependent metalloprotease [Candidatus Omnitrophota bacterium]
MIAIVFFKKADNELFAKLKGRLEGVFQSEDFSDSVLSLPLPLAAFNKKRRQYNSPEILRGMLDNSVLEDYNKVLGIVDEDLYTANLNFVFGQADSVGGKVCLVSAKRLYQSFYNLPENAVLFLMRLSKEAAHEIGHLLGLVHCHNKSCVMTYSESIREVDFKRGQFCSVCRDKIKEKY